MSRADRWRRSAAALAALLAVAVFPAGEAVARHVRIAVAPGASVEAAIARAPHGATVMLLDGRHEPFDVAEAVTIAGAPGAVVGGGIRVVAPDVTLRDLRIEGGESAVTVRDVDGVTIERVTIRGARMHGIEIVDASARIAGCRISDPAGEFTQGIEVRNALGRPHTTIRDCVITGGAEGIVSHVSAVDIVSVSVSDTTTWAIGVTEMSDGIVRDAVVSGALGVGLMCGDMSHCEFRRNRVSGVRADDSGVRSRVGIGALAHDHSVMLLDGNDLDAPVPFGVFIGSKVADASPLHSWPGRLRLPGNGK